MTGLEGLPGQKAPHLMRALLMPPHTTVPPGEVDERYMDLSPAHQAAMHRALYGPRVRAGVRECDAWSCLPSCLLPGLSHHLEAMAWTTAPPLPPGR